ncbi:MAG: ATP-binding protein [Geitlerinemataceae cyanobacterium]
MTNPLPNASVTNLDRALSTDLSDSAENQSFRDLTLLAAQVCSSDLAFVLVLGQGHEPASVVARRLDVALGPACLSLVMRAMDAAPADRVVTIADLPTLPAFESLSREAGLELADETALSLAARTTEGGQRELRSGSRELAIAPPIRFFCGVRLLTPNHSDVGVLCVLDTRVRVLGDRQRESLHALGRQATGVLRSLHAFGSTLARPSEADMTREPELEQLNFNTLLQSLPSYQNIVDILDRVTDSLIAVDYSWDVVDINTHAEQLWNLDRESALGCEIWNCLPSWRGTDFEKSCRKAARSRRAQKFEYYDVALDLWLDVRIYPASDLISIYLHETTNPQDAADDSSLERAHTSALVTAVSAALGQSQPLEQSLELCASALESNLGATSVGIWLLDRDLRADTDSAKTAVQAENLEEDPSLETHSRLTLAAVSGEPFPADFFPTTACWQEDSSWIARTSYPYCINSPIAQSSLLDRVPNPDNGLCFVVCYPLVVESRPIGILVLGSPQALPGSSYDILAWVANGPAIAVDRIWARDTLASRRKSLLFSLANQIRNTLELDTILTTAVREIRSLLQVDRCYYIWCTIEVDTRILAVTHEDAEPGLNSWIGELPTREEARLADSIASLESLYIDNVATEDEATREILESLGIVSQLVLPLGTRANQFGAIVCAHGKEARTWTHGEVELLHAAVDQLAIAIDQAEMYAKTCAAARAAETQARKLQDAMRNLKKTEAQLVQNEKMSSLGQMVAGIAHEINNPVNFISGNLTHANDYIGNLLALIDLYQEKYPKPDAAIEDEMEEIEFEFLQEDLPNLLESMRMGADRIREIVVSLRNFSRLDEADMKPVKIEDGIDSTLLILQSRLKANADVKAIEIIKNYGDLPPVACFPGSLNQVFMNLIANAIDAEDTNRKAENGNPQIAISTKSLGERVLISVTDNGSGIPEELVNQLFDPFFTTKPVGKGTGLGLSISYQIVVEQHGGRFWCESEVGKGTTFFVEIPIQQKEGEGMEGVPETFREFLGDPDDDSSEDMTEDTAADA